MTVQVRPMTLGDWVAVEAIYRDGISTGNATFEGAPPTWERFDERKLSTGRLVAVDENHEILAWVAASKVSERETYRGVIEHSVYVSRKHGGKGIGRQLLEEFIRATEAADFWTIQSSIFPENAASLALHARCGFREVGRRERIARMTYGPFAGEWRDTVLVERRAH